MTTKIQIHSTMSFKTLFQAEDITFYVDPEVTNENIVLGFSTEGNEQDEYKTDLILYVEKGNIKRCFCRLEALVLNNKIICNSPQVISIPNGGEEVTLIALENIHDIVELHWAKRKINLRPLKMVDGFPDVNALVEINSNKNFEKIEEKFINKK